MSERVGWITHKGQRVLRIDYSGLRDEEALRIIGQVPAFYKGQSKASVLCLLDVTNSLATQNTVDALKTMVKNVTREYDKKVAILGISGLKKAILITTNMFTGHSIKPFESNQEALDWLIS